MTRLPLVFIPVELSLHISVICLCSLPLWADCSASSPTQTLLRQQLNTSLQLAEKFSRLYDQLLQSYQQKMLDTSTLLKQLNEQFTWVSQLANLTQSDDQYYLQVFTVSPCWPRTAAAPAVRSGGRVVLPGGETASRCSRGHVSFRWSTCPTAGSKPSGTAVHGGPVAH